MSYWYLATPYSKFPGGINAAFKVACVNVALLVRARVPVFSPIAHTHPVAIEAGMDPLDHSIWMPCDQPMMEGARGAIMLRAASWEISYGMEIERKYFAEAGKPIVYMDPGVVPQEFMVERGKFAP